MDIVFSRSIFSHYNRSKRFKALTQSSSANSRTSKWILNLQRYNYEICLAKIIELKMLSPIFCMMSFPSWLLYCSPHPPQSQTCCNSTIPIRKANNFLPNYTRNRKFKSSSSFLMDFYFAKIASSSLPIPIGTTYSSKSTTTHPQGDIMNSNPLQPASLCPSTGRGQLKRLKLLSYCVALINRKIHTIIKIGTSLVFTST